MCFLSAGPPAPLFLPRMVHLCAGVVKCRLHFCLGGGIVVANNPKEALFMKVLPEQLRLYAVTDSRHLQGRTLLGTVSAALDGGATFVQLRDKDCSPAELLAEAHALAALCHTRGVPFVVDDDVEVALASGADGVHVGQSDMEAGDVRKRLGADKIIGVSAKTVEQALLAEKHGADYLGVGAVFTTSTKTDATGVSHETLRDICQAVKIPVVAIGGITKDNVDELSGYGADGIAVISAIFAQENITEAAKDLKQRSMQMVSSNGK